MQVFVDRAARMAIFRCVFGVRHAPVELTPSGVSPPTLCPGAVDEREP